VRNRKTTGVDRCPKFVFKQATRDQRFLPESVRRTAIFSQKLSKRDGRVEVNQRPSRSCCKSCISSSKLITGFRGGGPAAEPAMLGGLIHPSRTASARNASDRNALRPGCGGPSSATTRSRSVTSTVSPLAASLTYSLSLFLSTLRPTARIRHKVATGSYFVNLGATLDHRFNTSAPSDFALAATHA